MTMEFDPQYRRLCSANLTAAMSLGGRAFGVKHDYGSALDLDIATRATVAVAALDHRPYVVDGRKGSDFVGLSRGGFGNPFDVVTLSGKPLAQDISGSIVASMKGRGVAAKAVELKPALSIHEAGAALRAAGTQRAVMIRLQEWKADAMIDTGLDYDLELRVFGEDGRVLVAKLRQGSEALGSADPCRPGGASRVLPRFRRMMELLFREPDVVKALHP
jgi:hypothetical protein